MTKFYSKTDICRSLPSSLYVSENKNSAEQYIRNYLLNEYGTFREDYYGYDTVTVDEVAEEASSDSDNTIEENVDEADFINPDISGSWNDRSVIEDDAVHYVHNGKVYSSLWADPETYVVSG